MLKLLGDYLQQKSSQGIALAFSGGVDSSLLLAVLGKLHQENPFPVQALTMHSILQDEQEMSDAKDFAQKFGIKQKIFRFNPLEIEAVKYNRQERCYFCKRCIFQKFSDYSKEQGLIYLMDGTNADDLKTFRPGKKALQELGIISPLAELGFSKAQIRQLSQELGLATASKPAIPCLATRFAYNTFLDEEEITRVAKAEIKLKQLFPKIKDLRLRVHNDLARLEIQQADFPQIFSRYMEVVESLKSLGFKFITLDLQGFRSGSFDNNSKLKV